MILNYNRNDYCLNPNELRDLIVDDYKKYKPSVINICAAEEFVTGWNGQGLKDIRSRINYLFSNVDIDWYKNTFNPTTFISYNRSVEIWPTYFFKFCHYDQTQNNPNLFNLSFSHFKYPIMCLNKKMHNHRYDLILKFSDYDLIDGNAISWLGIESPEYLHLNRLLPPMMLTEMSSDIHDTMIPKEWVESFLHVVTESTLHARFITEKTVKCLFSNTFFIVWGAPKFHAALKDLGFELYNEIVDYSFDNILDHTQRLDALTKEVKRIIDQKNFEEMYNQIKPKLERNTAHALKLAADSWYPPMIDKYKINFYDYLIR